MFTEKGLMMAGFDAKLKNERGEYEITFHTKDLNEYKAVEFLCRKIMDSEETYKRITKDEAVDAIVTYFGEDESAQGNITELERRIREL